MKLRTLALAPLLVISCDHGVAVPPDLGTEADVPKGGGDEAPSGFDGQSNGFADAATFQDDLDEFDAVETIADGLGPLYNAQSCRECHQNPVSGGGSQIAELRAGHRDASGRFEAPRVPIARGKAFVEGRMLINDRAICPNGAHPDDQIEERVPDSETVRTFRLSVNVLGDGFIEAVDDDFLRDYAERQRRATDGRIAGLVVEVPVLEATAESHRVGRFGWKDQQASLLSFAADAYLNEMGITSRLQPDEVTTLCDEVADPEDTPGAAVTRRDRRAKAGISKPMRAATEEVADIDRFARFMRSTKAPPRDPVLAATEAARRGSKLFDQIGCATCHARNLVTVAAGTKINGGDFTVPAALGHKLFHPFSDLLLHDVGTGDGIAIAVVEHHGKAYRSMQPKMEPTANRIRTAPLWGLRMRSRLMHDGASFTLRDAIGRHAGEANDARSRFAALGSNDQEALVAFLESL
jgi:CxxC motif-containing protein (DUF1111 family)